MTLHYFRPTTLEEAVELLNRPGWRAAPLAGGAWLVPRLRSDIALADAPTPPVDAVVDLSGLGLDGIAAAGQPGQGMIHLGAMATLAQVAAHPVCRDAAGGVLARATQAALPVNQRHAATVGGFALSDEAPSELLLALLALDAHATLAGAGADAVPLAELRRGERRGLVTELRLPWPAASTRASMARVARTPGDVPIVAAVAVAAGSDCRVAVGGATAEPLLLTLFEGDDLAARLAAQIELHPMLSDWQGQSDYRREMAQVLAARAVAEAWSTPQPA